MATIIDRVRDCANHEPVMYRLVVNGAVRAQSMRSIDWAKMGSPLDEAERSRVAETLREWRRMANA